jgi:hypothetical protein
MSDHRVHRPVHPCRLATVFLGASSPDGRSSRPAEEPLCGPSARLLPAYLRYPVGVAISNPVSRPIAPPGPNLGSVTRTLLSHPKFTRLDWFGFLGPSQPVCPVFPGAERKLRGRTSRRQIDSRSSASHLPQSSHQPRPPQAGTARLGKAQPDISRWT